MHYETPQDAEDAYYDALEAGDAVAMADIWESSDKTACLLPMTPLATGQEVKRLWSAIFEQGARFDIEVRHHLWIENGDLAIHLIEERIGDQGVGQAPPAIYATNVFRRGPDGWHLLLHQNSPAALPPPGGPSSQRTAIA
jgi:ketosteroid isomerase-like protein